MEKTTKRINEMESILDECIGLNEELSRMAEKLEESKGRLRTLFDYYGSKLWFDDQTKTLPKGSKAGVLSQDAVYDQICGLRDNLDEITKQIEEILEAGE